jgi:hypothetical protein
MVLTVCYKLFTSYLRKMRSMNNWGKQLLTCEKICLNLHRSLRVCASYDEIVTDIEG